MLTYKELIAYKIAKDKYNNEPYDELWDEFFHYMDAYKHNRHSVEVIIFADCIENILGIREHKDIIKEILKYGKA
jgi:hypothetical protein